MPLYALIARELPDLERRERTRPAHLEHMNRLDDAGRLRYGGPLLDGDNGVAGSLIIIEADSLEEAQATYQQDPYIVNDVFEHYDIVETKQVYPRQA